MKNKILPMGLFFFFAGFCVFAQSNTMKALSGDDEKSQRIWFDTNTGLICYSLVNIETNPFRDNGAPFTRVVNNNNYKVTICYIAVNVFGRDYQIAGVVTLGAKETKEIRGTLSLKYSVQTEGVSAQTEMNSLKGNDVNSQRSWYDAKAGLQCYSISGIIITYARYSAVPRTWILNTNQYRVTVPYFGNEVLGYKNGVLGTITVEPGETKDVQGFYTIRQSVQY
jgi:hypothetical protein